MIDKQIKKILRRRIETASQIQQTQDEYTKEKEEAAEEMNTAV